MSRSPISPMATGQPCSSTRRASAGNNLAAGAGANCARAVSDEHVQGFGRADRVEDFNSEALLEALKDGGGQGLAGGNRVTHGGEVKFRARLAVVGEKGGEVGGHGIEQRGTVALDGGKDVGGARTVGEQDAGATDGQRKIEYIAQPISEEQFGDAEATVIGGHAQDAL